MQRAGKTFSNRISFFPSKHLLRQILVYEQAETYLTHTSEDFSSKDEMINRILLGDQYTDSLKHPKLILRSKEKQ